MNRKLKLALLVLAGILGTLVIVLVGVCAFLRTPAGSRFVLGEVTKTMAKDGIQLQYRVGEIDPFSHLHFEDLRLTRGGDNPIDVFIKTIDVRYQLAFFARELRVNQALIDHPAISVRMASSEKPAPTPSTTPALDRALQSLDSEVRKPMLKVVVERFALEDMDLDLDYRTPSSRIATRLHDTTLHFVLSLLKDHMAFSGDFQLGQAGPLTASYESEGQRLEVSALPSATAHWSVNLAPQGDRWLYSVEPSEAHAKLEKLVVTRGTAQPQTRLAADLGTVTLDSTLTLAASTDDLADPGHYRLSSVHAQNSLASGAARIEQNASEKSSLTRFRSQTTRFRSQTTRLDAEVADDLLVRSSFSLLGLEVPSLRNPADVTSSGTAHIARDFKTAKAEGSLALAGLPLLTYRADSQASGGITFDASAQGSLDPRLGKILKSGNGLAKLGTLSWQGEGKGKLEGKLESLLDLAGTKLDDASIAVDCTANVRQDTPGKGMRFDPLAMIAHVTRANDKIGFSGTLTTNATEAVSFHGSATSEAQGTAKNWHVDSKVETYLGDYLRYVLTPKKWREYGNWRTQSDLHVDTAKDLFKTDGSTTITQVRPAALSGVNVGQPLVVQHHLTYDHGKLTANLDGNAPSLEIPKKAELVDTRLTLEAHSQASHPSDVDLTASLRQGEIRLSPELAKKATSIPGLNASLALTVQGGDRFQLSNFAAEIDHKLVQLSAHATGRIKTKEVQTQGLAVLEVPKSFPELAGQKLGGRVDFPWSLSVQGGRQIIFSGELEASALSWANGTAAVSGLSGKMPVSEKLIWDGKHVRFASLITQNPFERVDFTRLRPLIDGTESSRIEKIVYLDKSFGPFVGFFSMSQNMFFAHQFSLSVGDTGQVYGESYLNFYPASLQAGFLTRLTSINLVDVLPKKYLVNVPSGDKSLSGRSGIIIDLNKSTVDGRVDITEIGGSQLITLINVLDPQYENAKMNMARSALSVGFPTLVEMSFQRGYLDLGLDLDVLGISKRFDVRDIPVSPFLANATADILKKTEKGVLE